MQCRCVHLCFRLCLRADCLYKIGISGEDSYSHYIFVTSLNCLSVFLATLILSSAHNNREKWISNSGAAEASVMRRLLPCLYISTTNRILFCLLLCHSPVAQCPGMPCCAFFYLPSERGCWMLQLTAHCFEVLNITSYTVVVTSKTGSISLLQARSSLLWHKHLCLICSGEG